MANFRKIRQVSLNHDLILHTWYDFECSPSITGTYVKVLGRYDENKWLELKEVEVYVSDQNTDDNTCPPGYNLSDDGPECRGSWIDACREDCMK